MDNYDAHKKATEIATQHLAECAAEIVEWRKTGILRDGYTRKMEAILYAVDEHHATRIAEGIVIQIALESVQAK